MNSKSQTPLREFPTIKLRREFLEKERNVRLAATASFFPSLDQARHRNCENMIGASQIPLGVAGPLQVKGMHAKGMYYVPLATTEGALVASVSRGAKAITLSAGAATLTENVGVSRGCVFQTSGIGQSKKMKEWIDKNRDTLSSVAQSTSSHLMLLSVACSFFGTYLFVRFSYDTSDAMGMNMVTIATNAVCAYIEKETGVRPVALAGNFDIDKKPAWLNFLFGRGRKVWAEVTIPHDILKNVLKTTSAHMHEVAISKNAYGSIASGSLGFNSHFANSIAALFIATGQDVAHTTEGSLGITTTEISKDGLYVSVYLPDLVIGTIGGGTYLPTQREALELLGVFGGDEGRNAACFSEIIAATVLAGEISLLASLAAGTLAHAHQKFARKK
jgi:hydroxymethylglutaryl-CoA reductase (NADPH)